MGAFSLHSMSSVLMRYMHSIFGRLTSSPFTSQTPGPCNGLCHGARNNLNDLTPLTPPMWTSRVRTQRVFDLVNDFRSLPRLPTTLHSPTLNLCYQEFGKVRNIMMDKRQHQHCFLSAHLVDLSWMNTLYQHTGRKIKQEAQPQQSSKLS